MDSSLEALIFLIYIKTRRKTNRRGELTQVAHFIKVVVALLLGCSAP